jgi:hypothetical protein
LFADIVDGDGREIGFGDLDGVAKGPIVTHLQGFDTSATLLVALKLGDPTLAVRGEGAKAIKFSIKPCTQRSTLTQIDGEFIAKGGLKSHKKLRLRINTAGLFRERSAGQGQQLLADRWKGTERIADPAKLTRIPKAILQAGEDAGDIADTPKGFADTGRGTRVLKEFADRVLPLGDRYEIG